MLHRWVVASCCCLMAAVSAPGIEAAGAPQRLALVVTRVVDGNGEPVEGAEVRLIRCRGERRFTMVASFEPANPSGVPVEPDRDNCDVHTDTTEADGMASFPNIRVGRTYIRAARGSTYTYLLTAAKPGYARVRRMITPHVARNDVVLVMYRTAGERTFALIDEAEQAVVAGELALAEARMIEAVAMLEAEVRVRDMATPDVLLEANRYLAWVQLQAGHGMLAQETLDELLALAPDDVYALRTTGIIAVQSRDWETAERYFDQYLMYYPDSGDAHLLKGNLLLETGRPATALDHLEQSIDLEPEEPLAYRSLGTAYERAGRLRDAIRSLETYLELAGEPADADQVRDTIAVLRQLIGRDA